MAKKRASAPRKKTVSVKKITVSKKKVVSNKKNDRKILLIIGAVLAVIFVLLSVLVLQQLHPEMYDIPR
jgi:hypothetical protein